MPHFTQCCWNSYNRSHKTSQHMIKGLVPKLRINFGLLVQAWLQFSYLQHYIQETCQHHTLVSLTLGKSSVEQDHRRVLVGKQTLNDNNCHIK